MLVWMAESARLFLVVQALPLHISLSLAQVVFIALVASLLTTIPALPGGLILVEGGIIAVLAFFGLSAESAFSVAILDRLISYWSLIGVGLVVFLLSHRR
jgi:glycosyltransferase 2 family protein